MFHSKFKINLPLAYNEINKLEESRVDPLNFSRCSPNPFGIPPAVEY